MKTLSFTTAKGRHTAARALAALLSEHAPGATVVIEPEGSVYGKRRVTVRASVGPVHSVCDLDAESTACGYVRWFIDHGGPRFSHVFGVMIGGSVSTYHQMKATGPFTDCIGRGKVEASGWASMSLAWAMALADVVAGDQGKAFDTTPEPAPVPYVPMIDPATGYDRRDASPEAAAAYVRACTAILRAA